MKINLLSGSVFYKSVLLKFILNSLFETKFFLHHKKVSSYTIKACNIDNLKTMLINSCVSLVENQGGHCISDLIAFVIIGNIIDPGKTNSSHKQNQHKA